MSGVIVPTGCKLVPIEPAEAMIQAACLSQCTEKSATYDEWWDSHSSGISTRIRTMLADDYAAMLAASPEIAPLVVSDTQGSEVLAMLARVLKYIDPRAVDMELARIGPMEDAYINTIARKCVERHLAIAGTPAAPATGAAK